MNANDLFQYLDGVRLQRNLSEIPIYISEKQSLFGVRELDTAVFISPSSNLNDSIVLCPVSMTREGDELKSIFGVDNGSEKN